ncbi:MAG: M13 family peptidase, partial [Cyanobacteria bacterium PR.023]|nr:M13 family peptidase [Cyanobacteria bacterium PR.023]
MLLANSALALTPPRKAAVDSPREPKIPSFSVDYLDKSVKPSVDFYRYANGNWIKNNPVPADKARWGSFSELAERNNFLIHGILKSASEEKYSPTSTPTARQKVGDFFASGMNTELIEKKRFEPIKSQLDSIAQLQTVDQMFKLLAD